MPKSLRTLVLSGLLLFCTVLHWPLQGQVLTAFYPDQKPGNENRRTQNVKPLVSILNDLEKKYNISFYYDPDLVAKKSGDANLLEPDKSGNVEAALAPLLEPANLKVKKVKNGYYLILPGALPKQEKNNSQKTPSQALIDVNITGKITDEKGEPLPGVTILLKGTSKGTASGPDGSYALSLAEASGTLVFSFIGYQTQEVAINNRSTIQVILVPDDKTLQEVLVVGYGVQQKKSLTGAVASVDETQLRAVPAGDAAAKLQGRVAGVTVTNNNSPGGAAAVRIRGIGSINNNDPLYIVDGVPTTGGLSNLNPNDIESMTVLKDASSSAIYGSRAANGVIVVTTKRGKSGKSQVSFDARYGVQKAANQLNLLNTQELGDLLWLEFKNRGLVPGGPGWGDLQYGYGATPVIPDYIFPAGKMAGEVDETLYAYPNPYYGITKANKAGTNWYDEIFSLAPLQEYNLAMSGGSDKSNYALSAGYMDQKGIANHTGFKRYSLRANSDVNITKWLEIGQSLGLAYTDRVSFGNNDEYNPVSMAHRMHPILPVYDIRGNYAGTKVLGTGNAMNPTSLLERNKDDYSREMRILANTYAQVNFTKDLSVKTLLGVDHSSNRMKDRSLMDPEYTQTNFTSRLSEGYSGGLQYNWANTLTYNKSIQGNHHVNVLLGTEALKSNYEFSTAARTTFAFTDLDYMVLDAGEKDMTNSGSFDQWSLFSYFGRVNYDFKGKYLLEGVVRRDASSRFSEANRWGTFPAFSAGWRISDEPFMSTVSWISELKLRSGWGQNGNDNVGNYNVYSTYRSAGNESYYNISGASTSKSEAGFHKYKLGNPDAKWEATSTTNIGLDLALFRNKLEANLDLFSRTTTNMLYPDSKPDTWGGLVLPSVNIGEMKNTGFDLMLAYRDVIGRDFNYTVRTNLSHYKNEVVRLNNNPSEIRFGNSLREELYTASKAGLPISSFYGYVVEGIFNTQEEVLAHAKYNPDINGKDAYSMPGVFKYKDVNGDGKITPDDRTFIGSPHPDLTYGLNMDLQYRNWDMTMFFQGVAGNDLTNYINRWTLFKQFEGNRKKERLYESWTAERYANGEKITVPIAINNDAAMQKPSSFFVENGSYFRMKDLQLGYTLPSLLLSKLNINRLRVYAQTTNLFTLTRYSGLDPEVSITNDRHMGVDEGIYPTSRMYMFGLNLNL